MDCLDPLPRGVYNPPVDNYPEQPADFLNPPYQGIIGIYWPGGPGRCIGPLPSCNNLGDAWEDPMGPLNLNETSCCSLVFWGEESDWYVPHPMCGWHEGPWDNANTYKCYCQGCENTMEYPPICPNHGGNLWGGFCDSGTSNQHCCNSG